MELVDVLDKDGKELNEVVDKDKAHKDGIYHPVTHIVVLSKDRSKILLQKRCSLKKIYPDMWDIAAAGHVGSGEEAIDSAKREFNEELGLDPNNYDFKYVGYFLETYDYKNYKVREYSHTYVIIDDIDIKNIKVQDEEVSDVRWFNKKEFNKLVEDKMLVKHEFYDYINNLMDKYFVFKELNNDEIISLYSKKPMNCNVSKEDKDLLIEEIEKDLDYKFKRVVGSKFQVHGNEVVIVEDINQEIGEVDGFLTNLNGIALEIRTADCQSIFLYDPVKKVIGNVHSGWKGTYKQIVIKAINKMIEHYGCDKKDIRVGINPSILGCCFEVKDDVINLFKEICDVDKYMKPYEDRYLLDTVAINYDKLIELGIKKEHIFLSNICTGCNTIEYHSYRKENKTEGRNISIICLK